MNRTKGRQRAFAIQWALQIFRWTEPSKPLRRRKRKCGVAAECDGCAGVMRSFPNVWLWTIIIAILASLATLTAIHDPFREFYRRTEAEAAQPRP